MPPRWLCVVIVVFWLACNGWLIWRHLLPRVAPGQPPPFAIDLVEEAQTQRPAVHWSVYRDDRKVMQARTRILHPGRDLFELTAEHLPPVGASEVSLPPIRLRRMSSTYRVNSAGELLAVRLRVEGVREVADERIAAEFTLTVDGEIREGWLHLGRKLESQLSWRGQDSETIHCGAVLMPLHPVKRLRGLQPGQSWQVVLLEAPGDPLGTIRGAGGEARLLHAHVRARVEEYTHGRYQEVPCLVIDYQGDDVQASTWVRQADGLVLCQEATLGKTRWGMYRD